MATLWALVTAISYAIAGVVIGQTCKKSHPLLVSMVVTVGTLFFFAFMCWLGPGFHLQARFYPYGVLIGVLFAFGNVLYYKAMSIGPMGAVSVTCSLAPIVPLFYDVFTGRSPNLFQAGGFFLVASGIWLVTLKRKEPTASQSTLNPFLLVIPASLIYGVNDVLFELSDAASMLGLLLVIQAAKLVASALIGLLVMPRIGSDDLRLLSLLPLGVLYGIGWIALDWSAKQGSIDITSSLEYTLPIFVAILARVFLKERLSQHQYIGFIFALVGVVAVEAFQPNGQASLPANSQDGEGAHFSLSHRLG